MKIDSLVNRSGHGWRLGVACAMVAYLVVNVANAQVLVTDNASIDANGASFAKQLKQTVDQYKLQGEQYINEVNQYKQMLSSIDVLKTGLGNMSNQLQPITDEGSYVEASCPGGSGSIMQTLTSSLTSVLGGSIAQQQQGVCAQIVHCQIDKYNNTVAMMNQLNHYAGQFEDVEKKLTSKGTMADDGRAANQAADYNNAVTTQMAAWQARMQSDDAMISSLQGEQDMLAKKLLRGSNTIMGNLVQAAALKAAFEVNK